MKTEDILKKIKEVQFDGVGHYNAFDFLSVGDFGKLEEIECETTNPRRDYVGKRYTLLNKEDGKYISIEFYGNEMGYEIYDFCEVEKVVEVKEIATYKPVNNET